MQRVAPVALLVVLMMSLTVSTHALGAVPQMINYQGRLTTSLGTPVNDTVTLDFSICPDSLCARSLWTESHTGVIITNGLFNVLLGSINPIPSSVFSGSLRWLSISINGDLATRRSQLVSVAYSYRALLADTAYYAKSGGQANCSDCDAIFVNAIGPDSVISTSGNAFSGKASGSSSSTLAGIQGYASNSSSGSADGGYFATSDSGTGVHFGVRGDGAGSSPSSAVYGVLGNANHSSSGDAYGGSFSANYGGSGVHYGVYAQGLGSTNYAYGVYGVGSANSGGYVYGGYFTALSGGTGIHYGLRAEGSGATSSGTYGAFGSADNTSSGSAFGGWFQTTSSGTGSHYGVRTESYGSSSALASGVTGWASNTSSGDAYGGDFSTSIGGTGHHYGVRGYGYASSPSSTYGAYGYGSNAAAGTVFGGYFTTASTGTGTHYGAVADGSGVTGSATYGIYASAQNTSTGTAYSGYFNTYPSGTGHHYGVYSTSDANSVNETYGVYGQANNSLSGDTYGGYFTTQNGGTGHHNGVAGFGYNDDTMSTAGVYGYAENSGGAAYGGYFGNGTGVGAGLLAWSPLPSNAAEFLGHAYIAYTLQIGYQCYIADKLVVYGEKDAAVKVDDGEYRLVSCQESPEVWFEDFGEGQLVDGKTHIELDPMYLQTVTIDGQNPMKVFVQLNDENCNGVAVKRGTTGFDVIELQKGSSNASFSYRIVAKRKGYENFRLNKLVGPTPEEMKAHNAKLQESVDVERARIEKQKQARTQQMQGLGKESAPKEGE